MLLTYPRSRGLSSDFGSVSEYSGVSSLHLDNLHYFEVVVVVRAAVGDGLSVRRAYRRTRIAADFTEQPDCLSHGRPNPALRFPQNVPAVFKISHEKVSFNANDWLRTKSADDSGEIQVVLL
jgi:hypothetical protein